MQFFWESWVYLCWQAGLSVDGYAQLALSRIFLTKLSNRLVNKGKIRLAGDQISFPYKISPNNDPWLRSLKYIGTCRHPGGQFYNRDLPTTARDLSSPGITQFPINHSAAVERLDRFCNHLPG